MTAVDTIVNRPNCTSITVDEYCDQLATPTLPTSTCFAAKEIVSPCITESETVSTSDVDLRRRLANIEQKYISERVTVNDEMTTIKAENERLRHHLLDLKKRYRVAKSKNKTMFKQLQRYEELAAIIEAKATKPHVERVFFAPSELSSQQQINQWMNENSERRYIFYRRSKNNNVVGSTSTSNQTESKEDKIALCVRTAANELVHSKIKRNANTGYYYCLSRSLRCFTFRIDDLVETRSMTTLDNKIIQFIDCVYLQSRALFDGNYTDNTLKEVHTSCRCRLSGNSLVANDESLARFCTLFYNRRLFVYVDL